MKLVVFGATSLVGKELVKQALYDDHEVKAYGRNVFTEGLPEKGKLELVQGALFDEGHVNKVIKGSDAVLCNLGNSLTDPSDKTRSLGIRNIIKQMEKTGVKRIVAVGGMGVLDSDADKLVGEEEGFPPEYFLVTEEHFKAYQALKASQLQWTFVCPSRIVEGQPTGVFVTKANQLPKGLEDPISSGDPVLFMLKEMQQKEFVQQRVGIAN